MTLVSLLLTFAVARVFSLVLHEATHALAALVLGYRDLRLRASWKCTTVTVDNVSDWGAFMIGHAGWTVSVALALIAARFASSAIVASAFVYTAGEAVASDLLGLAGDASRGIFACGNFGLIMLHALHRKHVLPILRLMMRTTMVRGAQSAGVVTYRQHRWKPNAAIAKRTRRVNGKRTDLSDLLLGRDGSRSSPVGAPQADTPQIFSGHTRFATSSIASMDGCHPHRWVPASWQQHWKYDDDSRTYVSSHKCVEAFVTHNGDLDYFTINRHEYTLSELQSILPNILHAPLPSATDSACINNPPGLTHTVPHRPV